jgi:hypothetical protein
MVPSKYSFIRHTYTNSTIEDIKKYILEQINNNPSIAKNITVDLSQIGITSETYNFTYTLYYMGDLYTMRLEQSPRLNLISLTCMFEGIIQWKITMSIEKGLHCKPISDCFKPVI